MPTTFSETPKRIAVKLKPAAERMVKKGHPWIFDRAIVKQSQEAVCGDLAIIYDRKKNKFLACGLFDPHSPIRIKLLQFHRPAPIDAEWFKNKLSIAFEKRQELLQTDTNSYRFLYGENDGFARLNCRCLCPSTSTQTLQRYLVAFYRFAVANFDRI